MAFLFGLLAAARNASIHCEITKLRIHNAFRKRPWVANRFLSQGNAAGMTYLDYLFDPTKTSDDEFRRELRVSREVFDKLENRLKHQLAPSQRSFRRDTIQTREKIAIGLHFFGHKGLPCIRSLS